MDTTDGVLMCKAYDWALLNPLRKIFYNVATTGVSIVVALVIGTIELLQLLRNLLGLDGAFFDFVGGLEFGALGYLIVGLFLLAWLLSVAWWRSAHFRRRHADKPLVHAHPHAHGGKLTSCMRTCMRMATSDTAIRIGIRSLSSGARAGAASAVGHRMGGRLPTPLRSSLG